MAQRLRFGALLMGAFMFSQSASALSCARPDLIRTLEEAKASPEIYHVFVGRFVTRGPVKRHAVVPDDGYMSPEDQFRERAPIITRSYFKGVSLAPRPRQDYLLSRYPVDVETSCIGPWCSSMPDSRQELIAFVEARPGQSPILRVSPCPSYTFRAGAKEVRKLRRCLSQTCESENTGW